MALFYSTCLRNNLLGKAASVGAKKVGANLAYADNGGSPDTITSSDNDFLTLGFYPGMYISTFGSTTAGNDKSCVILTDVVAGTITFITGTLAASEAFPAGGVLVGLHGGSLRDILHHGVINIYTVGSGIPASADAACTGSTLIATITTASGAWTAGALTNGLLLDPPVSALSVATISKPSAVWSGVCLPEGSSVMSFFRWVGNASDDGSADTGFIYPRIQGTIGTSTSYNLQVSSTTLAHDATLTIDTAVFTPAASV